MVLKTNQKPQLSIRYSNRIQFIIDGLSAHIAVLDQEGYIICVNSAWKLFSDQNGGCLTNYGVGTNYLDLCSTRFRTDRYRCSNLIYAADTEDYGEMAARGIAAVMQSETDKFQMTYPCHSAHEQRWFLLTATPMQIKGTRFAIIAHENVSTLKQGEQLTKAALMGTIEAISGIGELRDPYTAGHQSNVAKLGVEIAKVLNLPEDSITAIHLGGQIHDIGKIAIPAEILNKPGRLGDIEIQMLRQHCKIGHDLVSKITFPWPIASIILQHHERLDGSGYPDGLIKEQLLIESRIIAVADVIDAMASHRPYRASKGLSAAFNEIRVAAGVLYDNDVVNACGADTVLNLAKNLYSQ